MTTTQREIFDLLRSAINCVSLGHNNTAAVLVAEALRLLEENDG